MKNRFSHGFSLIEFFFGCLILSIVITGLVSSLKYFSKSSSRLSNDQRAKSLSEALRNEVINLTRGETWYTMTSSVLHATKDGFPNLVYDQTVYDIQNNARRIYTQIWHVMPQGNLELLKTDDYSVSQRPDSGTGSHIRIVATRNTLSGPPAAGITATAPATEGTIVCQCINDFKQLGTDNNGTCVITGARPGNNIPITINSGNVYYFDPFATSQVVTKNVVAGEEIIVNVIVKKKNKLIVQTYNRDGSNTNDPANNVQVYVQGTGLVSGKPESRMLATKTGENGNKAGEVQEWVYPGWWRVTVTGSDTRAGLDFPSSASGCGNPTPCANVGFVNFPQDSPDLYQRYYLPAVGSATGHVYKVTFSPSPTNDGIFNETGNGVNGVQLYYSQFDMRVTYDTWPAGLNVQPDNPAAITGNPTFAQYLNSTVNNGGRFDPKTCTSVFPNCNGGYAQWPIRTGPITDSNGRYTINSIAPLAVYKAPGSDSPYGSSAFTTPNMPENARVWARYWSESSVADAVPILYAPVHSNQALTRANSTFVLNYSGLTKWITYPINTISPQWPSALFADIIAGQTITQDIYMLAYDPSNFLHPVFRMLIGGNYYTGNIEGNTTQSWGRLRIFNPSPAPGIYVDQAAYIGTSGGKYILKQSPVITSDNNPFGTGSIAVNQNQRLEFKDIVPPLGTDQLYYEYKSGGLTDGDNDTTYNISVVVFYNEDNGSGGYIHKPDTSLTDDISRTLQIQAAKFLQNGYDTFINLAHFPYVTNGQAAALTNQLRKKTTGYYVGKPISGHDLDPTGGPQDFPVTIDPATDQHDTTPAHQMLLDHGFIGRYLPVNQQERAAWAYPLGLSGNVYSGTVYLIEQRHLQFGGYVYDTSDPTHSAPIPFVQVFINWKEPAGYGDQTIKIIADQHAPATGLSPCAYSPGACPPDAQYRTDAWVPMMNMGGQYQIQILDPAGRFQPINSAVKPVTRNTSESDIQQFDAPLVRVAGTGL